MDINKAIATLKQRPGFTDNVGMMLVHNGVVRSWSRDEHKSVSSITITQDKDKIRAICEEVEKKPGIFAIVFEALEGEFKPGDDVLFFIVAGDIRENVKAAYAEVLERIKSEGVSKQEHFIL